MRHAFITGAAGGIGQALAAAFTRDGYSVIATDRGPAPEGLACSHYLRLDLAEFVEDEAKADAALAQVRDWLGGAGLHVLVNNAAVQILGSMDELSRRDWRATLDVNLVAPFLVTQGLLPELEAARGCVVNVSSIHARLTKRGFVAYATSKAALSGLTRVMAVDLGARVRVHAIEPAAIDTPMLRAGFEGQPEAFAQLEACHPVGRLGLPEEVAALAVHLAAQTDGFLHGACIPLDGGVGNRLHDPA